MKKVKQIVMSVLRSNIFKYGLVLVIGIVFVGFLDENSVWAHLHHKQTIADLKEEISFYDKAYQRDQRRIRELQTNPKAMEKIARERYFMKTSDEDIFVLSDDEEYYNQKRVSSDETVE